MKSKRTAGLIRLLIVALLAVCAVCAFGAVASASGENSLEIQYTNLAYNEKTHIAVTLVGTVAEGSEKGIAVWDADVEGTLTLDNATFTDFTAYHDKNGVEYYRTSGIPASLMSERMTIAPIVKSADGAVSIAGESIEYSIMDYVMNRLDDENLADYQVDLYRKLLIYGTAAEKVLGDGVASRTIVMADGGYVGEKNFPMALVEGETALLRAPVQNTAGEYFSYWADSDGVMVSGERVVNVAVENGINSFTAVYGEKAGSPYRYFADLQSMTTGKYAFEVTAESLTDEQKTSGTVNRIFPLFRRSDGSYAGISAKLTVDVSDLTAGKLLPITGGDTVTVVESYDGIKHAVFDKVYHSSGGYYYASLVDTINETYRNDYERFEMDINISSSSINCTTYFRFYNPTGAYKDVLFSFARSGNAMRIYYYTAANYGGTKYLDIDVDGGTEIVTVGIEMDENGATILYINGEAAELAAPIVPYDGIAAGDWSPARFQFETPNAGAFTYEIYSFGFVDTDLIKK